MPVIKFEACAIALLLTWPDSESVIGAGLPSALRVFFAARLDLIFLAGFFGTLLAGRLCYRWLERPLLAPARSVQA